VGLQAATTSGRPVVLRVETHGGHSLGSARYQESALLAGELAFCLHRSAWTILTEGGHQMQQGGLARARRADDGGEFTLVDGQAHPRNVCAGGSPG
jgi:predicted amidophosphoribosyltransferase